jgi:FixJ family two-component response regulator
MASAGAGTRTLVSVVDDDPSVRRALQRLLESAGFSVATFASGRQVLQIGLVQTTACLVIDVHLGDMDGFELSRLLAAEGMNIPLIFITAHDDEPAKVSARRAGAVAYFTKPIEGEILLDAIRRATRGAAPAA